jgi:hypothetical protein
MPHYDAAHAPANGSQACWKDWLRGKATLTHAPATGSRAQTITH